MKSERLIDKYLASDSMDDTFEELYQEYDSEKRDRKRARKLHRSEKNSKLSHHEQVTEKVSALFDPRYAQNNQVAPAKRCEGPRLQGFYTYQANHEDQVLDSASIKRSLEDIEKDIAKVVKDIFGEEEVAPIVQPEIPIEMPFDRNLANRLLLAFEHYSRQTSTHGASVTMGNGLKNFYLTVYSPAKINYYLERTSLNSWKWTDGVKAVVSGTYNQPEEVVQAFIDTVLTY
jgi:hypothetical protein